MQVVFTLHASFANPTRELAEPPYEVTEHGWGEFEIVVEVSIPTTTCIEGLDLRMLQAT